MKIKDGDFEDIFGPEIDEFLQEGSQADEVKAAVDSLVNLEKDYLKVENSKRVSPRKSINSPSNSLNKKASQSHIQKGPDRELMINFSDNPGVIHRGEILPFHI